MSEASPETDIIAAQLAEHKAMLESAIAQQQAAIESEGQLFNQTQQAIQNAVNEQALRQGRLEAQSASLRALIALRDRMFPPPPPAPDVPPGPETHS